MFGDLPFERGALGSQPSLLNALAGSEVEIEGEVSAKGRVLAVEEETVQLPNNGGETKRHRLSLLTSNGFVQAVLENVRALRFTDAQTRSQIERALAAVAQAHGKDRRTLSVNLAGEGRSHCEFELCCGGARLENCISARAPKRGRRGKSSVATASNRSKQNR